MIPIWPTWRQIKIGPYIRLEIDKRSYSKLFAYSDNYINGFKKLKLLASFSRHSVDDHALPLLNHNKYIAVFSGMEGLFDPLLGRHELIKNELIKIVAHDLKLLMQHDFTNTISVHVRLGDFSAFDEKKFSYGTTNMKMPISWYIDVIETLRDGKSNKVYIFSDGSDQELSSLLSLPSVERMTFGSAVADMLALSNANILVASNSTFSLWASYLGRMPVVRPKGRDKLVLYPENPLSEQTIEFGGQISSDFLQVIKQNKLLTT